MGFCTEPGNITLTDGSDYPIFSLDSAASKPRLFKLSGAVKPTSSQQLILNWGQYYQNALTGVRIKKGSRLEIFKAS